jgi:predicted Zn-dependent protease
MEIPAFNIRFSEFLKAAFQDWVSASAGKISIRFVDQPADADIECLWSSNPAQLRNRAEGGEAQVYSQDGLIQKATIIILTVPTNRANGISDNFISSIALHEVGHALGLFGHSPNPQDAMFFSTGVRDNDKPQLSARDRKTILRLYSER